MQLPSALTALLSVCIVLKGFYRSVKQGADFKKEFVATRNQAAFGDFGSAQAEPAIACIVRPIVEVKDGRSIEGR